MAQNQYVFVFGCPRSGTTAISELLISHKRIAIGMERYKLYFNKNDIEKINESKFDMEKFFDFKDYETNIQPKAQEKYRVYYEKIREKYEKYNDCDELILGDKVPNGHNFLQEINRQFENVKIIIMLRDVFALALSYDARAKNPKDINWKKTFNYKIAVNHWNNCLAKTWHYLKEHNNLFICQYERIFAYDENYLESIIKFLELDMDGNLIECYGEMTKGWEQRFHKSKNAIENMENNEVDYIQENANFSLRDKILDKYCK